MDLLARELAALQKSENRNPASQKKASADPKPSVPAAPQQHHVVAAGETLYQISRRYGLTVEALRRMNNLDETATIHPGQKLILRLPSPSP